MPRLCRVKADNFASTGGGLHSAYYSSCEVIGGLLGWEMGSDDDDTWFAFFVNIAMAVLDPNSCWFQMFIVFTAAGIAFFIGAYMRRMTIVSLLRQKEEWVDKEKMLLNQLWAALEEKLESKSMLQEARVSLDKVKAQIQEANISEHLAEDEKRKKREELEEKKKRAEELRIELDQICERERQLREELGEKRRESLRNLGENSTADSDKYDRSTCIHNNLSKENKVHSHQMLHEDNDKSNDRRGSATQDLTNLTLEHSSKDKLEDVSKPMSSQVRLRNHSSTPITASSQKRRENNDKSNDRRGSPTQDLTNLTLEHSSKDKLEDVNKPMSSQVRLRNHSSTPITASSKKLSPVHNSRRSLARVDSDLARNNELRDQTSKRELSKNLSYVSNNRRSSAKINSNLIINDELRDENITPNNSSDNVTDNNVFKSQSQNFSVAPKIEPSRATLNKVDSAVQTIDNNYNSREQLMSKTQLSSAKLLNDGNNTSLGSSSPKQRQDSITVYKSRSKVAPTPQHSNQAIYDTGQKNPPDTNEDNVYNRTPLPNTSNNLKPIGNSNDTPQAGHGSVSSLRSNASENKNSQTQIKSAEIEPNQNTDKQNSVYGGIAKVYEVAKKPSENLDKIVEIAKKEKEDKEQYSSDIAYTTAFEVQQQMSFNASKLFLKMNTNAPSAPVINDQYGSKTLLNKTYNVENEPIYEEIEDKITNKSDLSHNSVDSNSAESLD